MSLDNRDSAKEEASRPNRKSEEPERTGGYRYYLEDRPVLVPVLTIVLGGLCLYTTVFTNVLRDMIVGSKGDRSMLEGFNRATGWSVAFVVALMALATIFLMVHFAEVGYRKARRRPAVCPQCGLGETRALRFAHQAVKGTDWEHITCPKCASTWHGRR